MSWRGHNRDYDREARLRGRLVGAFPPTDAGEGWLLSRRVDESVARDAVGLQVYVFIDETARLLAEWARDEIMEQRHVITGEIGRHLDGGARDEIARGGPAP